ncbi:non-specific lipid-transfer protein C, cotyledon-specific isoform-like [Mangifera indica]|uniref:non-specific lipid-transfer protein C, cotyledon-specific isoform-like n=1 Tax=Mangifera indica TaxID=29780 RepID=UPI001CFAD1F9|nr:non-specific lipid-transfer protein C, cotyledon-specific isoform-like [Mangifera indica]
MTVTLPYLAMKNLYFSMLLLLSVLFFLANDGEATVKCSSLVYKAAGCVDYVTGKAKDPGITCCIGLQQLAQSVKSVDDKKDICRCLKKGAGPVPINDWLLSQLPSRCHIDVGFPVSSKTNCETIH